MKQQLPIVSHNSLGGQSKQSTVQVDTTVIVGSDSNNFSSGDSGIDTSIAASATLSRLRGSKEAKSVDELEADLTQQQVHQFYLKIQGSAKRFW